MESQDKITAYFSRYHKNYRTSDRHAKGADLAELLESLALPQGSAVLDAACGTGHTTLALAGAGFKATGLDLTPEMIEEGRSLAAERQLTVAWALGDVHKMPWDTGHFAGVTCRRAAHHFVDLPGFLDECRRVLKFGGILGISDMTAPSLAIDDLNCAERIRDDSHFAARSPRQWCDLVDDAGFNLRYLHVSEEPMTPEEWLAPVGPI
jgi:ubiquinone/menaquinone biosynthesis C-methylase UbiE